ncbi:MAG: MBL fold metallo-hydrolase [Anaerolineae bacterium]
MEKVVDGVYTFTGLIAGRVYLTIDDDGLSLIDASIPPAADKILDQLQKAGHQPSDLKRILVTHAHPDHVGAIPKLVAETGAEVIVSEGERAALEGEIAIPSAPGWLKPPKTILEDMKADRVIKYGDTVSETLGGLVAIATPGHAPGHTSFWQPDRKIMFIGDVIFNAPRMRMPYSFLTVDMAQNIRSVKNIIDLAPEVACFGHGKPLVQNTAEVLSKFYSKY